MKIKVQLVVCDDDGHEETVTDVVVLKKACQQLEQVGLSLAEAKSLLAALQKQIVERQAAAFLATGTHCQTWGIPLRTKGSHTSTFRTLFGTLRLRSPRLHRCPCHSQTQQYLAVVLDLCSRAVVGWSMANHMRAELVNQALSMALCQRQPAAVLIMHTDRGSQYGADSYRQLLAQHGIAPSMSRKGNCWDNAVAESFFHTPKTELVYLENFDTHEHVQMAVFEYIEVFYNRQRCHSANGYLAPLAYEQALKTHGIFCPEKC